MQRSIKGRDFFGGYVLVLGVTLWGLFPVRVDAEYMRWTDGGYSHLWTERANWHTGQLPGPDDRFLSTPYYSGLPYSKWLQYRLIIDEGVDAVCGSAKNMNQLTMDITGGSFTVMNEWKIGQDDGEGVIINMTDGLVNVGTYVDLGGWSENSSMGTLNMSGGTFSVSGSLRMGMWDTTRSFLNLDGGVVRVGTLDFGPGEALIDITEGMLVLPGNRTGTVDWCIDSGRIVAFGGTSGVLCDYNQTVSGHTVVKAVPEPATILILGVGGIGWVRRRR